MTSCPALLLLACLGLSAQEDPFGLDLPQPATLTRVAVGGYDQAFSDGYGRWKGWTLEGTLYPADGGPWQLAAVGFDRPEGQGTLFSAGKHVLIGKASSIYVGASAGTRTDVLPRGRMDVGLHLGVASGWFLDLAGALSRFDGDQEIRMVQAGPGYQGRSWSASAWYQRLQYEPYGDFDDGCILNLRFGGNDFARWHSLRLAWGRGILESTASGGGLTSAASSMASGISGSGRRFSPGGSGPMMMGSSSSLPAALAADRPQERLTSLSGHWPLTGALALQAEATWGEKVSVTHFWGGSLQVVVTF